MLVKKIVSAGLLIIAVSMVGILLAPTLQAQTTPTSAQCAIAQARLTTRITKVDTVHAAQTNVYTNLQTRLETIITSATEAGYDEDGIAALTLAQTTVNTKIEAYTTAADAYTAALEAAKGKDCSTTVAEFRTAVIEARAARASLLTAATDVRASFRSDVIPALKDYAAWLKEQSDTTEGN
jgi:hypothetical protein